MPQKSSASEKQTTTAVDIAPGVSFNGGNTPVLLGGPCVIESEAHLLKVGERIRDIAAAQGFPFVLKASFDKANRTSVDAFRGPGLVEGLEILGRVKRTLGVPVMTDVHEVSQVAAAAEVADVLQIPAFLCRQTDLLIAVAKTGKPVNIKKGQFLSPLELRFAIEKVERAGNQRILLTERGSMFGYNNLVVDMRSLILLRSLGYPVVFDATHAVQMPGSLGDATGGERRFVAPLVRAATAVGIDGLFLEIHDDPDHAPCDGPNMLPVDALAGLLEQVKALHQIARTS